MEATTASITTINGQLNDLVSIQIRPPQSPCGEKVTRKTMEFIVYDKLDRVTATGPALSPFSDTAVGAVVG
jgi:hypothetical protein